jgi:hypothetical protein
MAMMRYSSATVVEPCIKPVVWEENINHRSVVCDDKNCRIKTAKTVLAKYSPEKYLLSHCTIIAAVDTELANPTDPQSDYFIHPAYSKFINNNGDAWSKQMLASCYHSFVGSNNYLEHVQIPELSKGKVVDAILREVTIGRDKTGKDLTTYYVDILVATDKKHKDLIRKIEAKELSTLSMGCKIAYGICSKCGKKAVDETEACQHVRFEKNNTFYDDNGVQRKVGELCGHFSEPESVTFIDASWVRNPAFTGAVIRNIVTPPENIMAKLDEASKKDSYVVQDGDFLKAAYKKAQDEDKPTEDEPTKDEPKEEEPKDEPSGAEEPAVEDNAAPGEEEGAPEETPTPAPAPEAPPPEESPVKTWKKDIKKKLLDELSNDLIKEFTEETEGKTDQLETLDESLIQPTASSALRKMWLFKRGWEKYLKKTAKDMDRKNFEKLRFGTYMILTSKDLTALADYGYNRRDFLAIMSYLDKNFKNALSLGIKKAIAELNGTKDLTLREAMYSLQKLASRKLLKEEMKKALTWLKAMEYYPK